MVFVQVTPLSVLGFLPCKGGNNSSRPLSGGEVGNSSWAPWAGSVPVNQVLVRRADPWAASDLSQKLQEGLGWRTGGRRPLL